jgi:hypothetical protein
MNGTTVSDKQQQGSVCHSVVQKKSAGTHLGGLHVLVVVVVVTPSGRLAG